MYHIFIFAMKLHITSKAKWPSDCLSKIRLKISNNNDEMCFFVFSKRLEKTTFFREIIFRIVIELFYH